MILKYGQCINHQWLWILKCSNSKAAWNEKLKGKLEEKKYIAINKDKKKGVPF